MSAGDSRLKRQVAIKVLPQTMAADPERLARFQREAEVLAGLNHPNIAHIYGLDRQEGRAGQDAVAFFDAPVQSGYTNDSHRWQVSPDGKRFLLITNAGKDQAPPLDVVVNWQAGLKK